MAQRFSFHRPWPMVTSDRRASTLPCGFQGRRPRLLSTVCRWTHREPTQEWLLSYPWSEILARWQLSAHATGRVPALSRLEGADSEEY
jgi:hypothetical protein